MRKIGNSSAMGGPFRLFPANPGPADPFLSIPCMGLRPYPFKDTTLDTPTPAVFGRVLRPDPGPTA